jgi:hypothetical protein
MARGFPPSSAYLGSDLPEDELRMPASAPAGGPPAGGDPLAGYGDEMQDPGTNSPVGTMPPSDGGWEGDLAEAAQRAGIDPILLGGPPEGMPTSEWIGALRPLQEQLTTDSEISAYEMMLDANGALGSTLGEPPSHSDPREGHGQTSTAVGKPGAADPSFVPDQPGRGRY